MVSGLQHEIEDHARRHQVSVARVKEMKARVRVGVSMCIGVCVCVSVPAL